ncbi:autotransporter outer membrane beta-barrel domain-containing protein [Endozoicomonas gorgoniicola]|uniref:Autotransporter outer membrane beta-barrel domain-containing protein n=1 Tax=Endozoicomonas gorgoniicola TaxID=1234144 RepID=A0ABT3MX39_9GAMM|nr:autotransporter outer membrane beta-barrel domain-containing protein [Endozoicomonas gorgoniicola]MCW7553942.1 autotransporter outer membrane beta-barrel domain-containing protein [Endozoicomonas gorgoniicola]
MSSCTIDVSKSAKGTLYTVKDGASGQLTLTGFQEALYRGSVLRFEGDSSAMTVKILPEAQLSADYDAIEITEGAKTGIITIQGKVNSRFQHALNVHAGSQHQKIQIDQNAVLSNQSPYHPAVHIDNTATGELLFNGKGESEQSNVLMYSTDPNHLWGMDKLPAGIHKLVMPDTAELDSSKSPLVLGNKEHVLISDTPSSWCFADDSVIRMDASFLPGNYIEGTALIEGSDIVFGKNSKLFFKGLPPIGKTFTLFSATGQLIPPEVISANLFWIVVTELTTKPNHFNITFVARNDKVVINDLQSMGLSHNQALVVLNSYKYAPQAVKKEINRRINDNSYKYAPQTVQKEINRRINDNNALKALAEELTPRLAHTGTIVLDMSRKTSSVVDNRLALIQSKNTGVNTGDNMSGRHFWLEASGSKAELKSHQDDPGYDAKQYGITLGYDHDLPDTEHLVGVVFAYRKSDGDFAAGNKIDTRAWQLGIYGNVNMNTFGLEPQFIYTRARHSSKRRFNRQEDKADYNGNAYSFRMLAWWPMPIQPLAGLNITHVSTDKHHFRLTDQQIQSTSQTAYEAGVGARYFPNRAGFSPKAQVMLWYNFSNDSLDTHYRIGNGPVSVVSQSRDKQPLSLSGLLGFDYTSGQITSGCDINGVYRKNFSDMGFSCRFQYDF